MKKIILVVLLSISSYCVAESLPDALNNIESEWAKIYYQLPEQQQGQAYARLLDKTIKLCEKYPLDTGAMFWQAVVKASYADHQDPISAINAIHEVRNLLNKAIAINPNTMEGSAYVVLGTLYQMAPAWPIAFGDDEEAEKLFQTALKISPNGIDSNYYYGQFLLSNKQLKEAQSYFEKAVAAPVRPEQVFADTQLQEEAKHALNHFSDVEVSNKKRLFSSLSHSSTGSK